jgi:hypothetical protein
MMDQSGGGLLLAERHRQRGGDEFAPHVRMIGSSSKIKHLPMRKGEDQDLPVELLPKPYASDLLPKSAESVPLEFGMSETIAYYAKIDGAKRRDILDFYYA